MDSEFHNRSKAAHGERRQRQGFLAGFKLTAKQRWLRLRAGWGALTRVFMSARALSEKPISLMQWWIRLGPSLPWATSKPRPGPSTTFSLGTRTFSNRTSPWPPARPEHTGPEPSTKALSWAGVAPCLGLICCPGTGFYGDTGRAGRRSLLQMENESLMSNGKWLFCRYSDRHKMLLAEADSP